MQTVPCGYSFFVHSTNKIKNCEKLLQEKVQLKSGKIIISYYTVPIIIIGVMLHRRVSLKVESDFNMYVSEFQDLPLLNPTKKQKREFARNKLDFS